MTTARDPFDQALEDSAEILDQAATETLEDDSVQAALEDDSVDEAW